MNRFGLLFLFLFITLFSFGQSKPSDTTRILFIGNSYTYFNSCPELLRNMAEERFPDQIIETKLISQGGMTLNKHWETGKAQRTIQAVKWDFVILQEQSKLGMPVIIDDQAYIGSTEQFYQYARKFDKEITKSGAQTVFFMTWSVKNRPEDQAILTEAYSTIARELNSIVAPVGLVWDELRNNNHFDLYTRDGSHPSPHGSFLAATTIFTTLFKVNPSGLSGKISGYHLSSSGHPSSQSSLLINISSDDAREIQNSTYKVFRELEKTIAP